MSAVLQRFEACELEHAHQRLARYPELQPEAIARHYLYHAALARDLLELTRFRRYRGDHPDVAALIERITSQLKAAHRRDLGLELEWSPEQPRLEQYRGVERPLAEVLAALQEHESSTCAKSQTDPNA